MKGWRRFSRLPQSEAYWQRLSARMQTSAHAAGELPAEPTCSLAPFAWTAMAAAAVAVIALAYRPSPRHQANALAALLAPADSTGAVWVERTRPPDAAEVLLAHWGSR